MEKQICKNVEGREVKSFNLEKPTGHPSGDAVEPLDAQVRSSGTKSKVEVDIWECPHMGGQLNAVKCCLCGPDHPSSSRISAAPSMKLSWTVPGLSFAFLLFLLN